MCMFFFESRFVIYQVKTFKGAAFSFGSHIKSEWRSTSHTQTLQIDQASKQNKTFYECLAYFVITICTM